MDEALETVDLIATHGIRLDGRKIAPDTLFSADVDTAALLIVEGAAVEAETADRTDEQAVPPAEQAEGSDARLAAIVAVAGQLTAEDYTQGGAPKVAVVEKLVGFDVTAKEIASAAAMIAERDI